MVEITKRTLLMEYLLMIVGSTIVGLSFNIFLLPARIAAGGVTVISTLLYELYQFSPAVVQWTFNIPIFIVGLCTAGKRFQFKINRWNSFCAAGDMA